MKFFKCNECGVLINVFSDNEKHKSCCKKELKEITANTSEGATEKHLPVINVDGNKINVNVGSTTHPMTEEHSIEWIYIQTKKGGQYKLLSPIEQPCASFLITDDDKLISAYAYCNLHGLWKTDL